MLSQIFIVGVVICIIILLFHNNENYDSNRYDYCRENPNALQHGKVIGGTVYSDYPRKTPGLGWVL
jgi:hypothetical protein